MRGSSSSDYTSQSVINVVQIDGLVVLKIIKHHHEELVQGNDVVQGALLGLPQDQRLEITNCFPFPKLGDDEDFNELTSASTNPETSNIDAEVRDFEIDGDYDRIIIGVEAASVDADNELANFYTLGTMTYTEPVYD